jgi:mono/diheme cytochrome c family protein
MTKRDRERRWGQRWDFAGARPPGGAGPLTLATGVVIGTILLVGARPDHGAENGSGEAVPARAADVVRLYDKHCRSCHGVDGRGQDLREGLPTMPDFTSDAWQKAHTDADVSRAVTEGSGPLMPAFREKLTKDQIEALTAHLRSFANAAAGRKPMMIARRAARQSPEQLFKDNACVKCHDMDGRGTTGRKIMPEIPDFTDAKWQKERGDDDLTKSILEGKGKFMVPQKDKLSKDEVKQLVDYIRSFKGKSDKAEPKDPPKADVAPASTAPRPIGPSAEEAALLRAGAATFRDKCGNCHGADGKGSEVRAVMPAIPDFTSRPWHQSRSDAQLSVSILEGKGTQMPSFRDKVKAEQVKGLLAYVRTFGPGQQTAVDGSSDFDQKMRRLQEEFEELKRQRDELTKKSKQP